jgi:signal transduction histidine kinase
MHQILELLLEGLAVDVGTFWVTKGKLLLPFLASGEGGGAPVAAFLDENRRLSFGAGESLPGRIWQEPRATWIADFAREAKDSRKDLVFRASLVSALAFPVQSAGNVLGVFEFFSRNRLQEDPELSNMITAVGSEIGQFIRRRRAEEDLRRAHDELEMRVQQRTAELETANASLSAAIEARERLEHELLEITERERRRIGLDLHDDLGQKLAGVALMIKGLELKLAKQGVKESSDATKIHDLVQQAMNHTRDVAQQLATFDPRELTLGDALKRLAQHAETAFEISCRFKAEGHVPKLDSNAVSQLYKIAQEAVTNAIKHGKAKKVGINLSNGTDRVVLTVQNDGKPFPDLSSRTTGMGLRIMNYRASLIGAKLEVKGTGGKGTKVTCSVPVAAEDA